MQTCNAHTTPVNTPEEMPFSGTVAVGRSLEAKRMAAGQNTTGSLLIMTGFNLAQGWPVSINPDADHLVGSIDYHGAPGENQGRG